MKIIEKLVKKFDENKTFKFSDVDIFSEESAWISTGSPYLDYMLRTLGYPTGIIEMRGKSQSGKTTLSIHAMINCIKEYQERAIVVILSSERRDNKIYARQLGLDTTSVILHRVKTIEDVFNKMKQTVNEVRALINDEKEGIDIKRPRFLFIWDSLGQTVAAQEKKKMNQRAEATNEKDSEGQAAMGSAARALSIGLRDVVGLTDEEDLTLFIVNRAYENIGSAGKTSYGGQAITFYPSIRFDLVRIQGLNFTQDGEEMGQITQVIPFKTDFDRPKKKIIVEIGYGLGIVLSSYDIDMGFEAGILEKHDNGASFMNGKLKWRNRRQLYELYKEKNPLLKILIRKLTKIAHDKVLKERAKEAEE